MKHEKENSFQIYIEIWYNYNCFLQFEDPYRSPPKFWRFCDFSVPSPTTLNVDTSVVVLQSYLNVFRMTQVTSNIDAPNSKRLRFRVTATMVRDEDLALKVSCCALPFGGMEHV